MDINLSEYEDPILYDLENPSSSELPFLLDLAEKYVKKGEKILELGCGTGRITIPMAEAGYSLIAVDIHEEMLNRAKEKMSPCHSIDWHLQDCRQLHLDVRVPFVFMTGHVFQHFLTNEDQDQALQSVYRCLKDHGVFVFDTRFPSFEEHALSDHETFWRTVIDAQGRTVQIYIKEQYDPIKQIEHCKVIRCFFDAGRFVEEKESFIDLRYTYPQEMKHLLDKNGFKLLRICDGWKDRPMTQYTESMVVICKKENNNV